MEKRQVSSDEVRRILSDHDLWVKTNHESGQQADFTNCDLRGFDFCSPNESHPFHSMIFRRADLSGVSMERLHFKDCDFTDTCLDEAKITGVHFEDCNFLNAHMMNVNFAVCKFEDNSMQNTFLGNSKFTACYFFDNSFNNTHLNGVRTTYLCDFYNNNFVNVNPVYADFSNTEFIANRFTNGDFIRCTFDHTVFERSHFERSGFLDSYIEKCDFRQTNLQNAFTSTTFYLKNGEEIHMTCDLDTQRIISRDLFEDPPSMRISDFIKEISASPAHDSINRALKKTLLMVGKMFQEQCADYKNLKEHAR